MAAKEHPRYASTEWPDYEFQEYPKMVYPGAKDPKKPYVVRDGRDKGKALKGIIVNNEDEERTALGLAPEVEDGEEAVFEPRGEDRVAPTGSPGTSRLVSAEDQKQELLNEATALGVQVDRRWSPARIQDAIDTHKQEVV